MRVWEMGMLTDVQIVTDRQLTATISNQGNGNTGGSFGLAANAQAIDGVYYYSKNQDVGPYLEVLRLDFGRPIVIEEISLAGLGAQDAFQSGVLPGMAWYVAADLSGANNIGVQGATDQAGGTTYTYPVSLTVQQLSLWTKSVTNFTNGQYTINTLIECFRIRGEL